ncbi:hypothetical protein SSX86_008881 [Deinandra increscens subsp. villosa]|uniref:F-box domain-containing protein n=1 Tax=Deinandra increscens subsp. villosa TaxID=3103831 RepID=A0AAP0H5G3_9ASTR
MPDFPLPLPHDIVIDILLRLPAKSLGRFKSVSKFWLSLISSADFIKSHVHRAVSDTNTNHTRVVMRSTHSLHSVNFESPSCYKDIDDDDHDYDYGYGYGYDYDDDTKDIISLNDPSQTEKEMVAEKGWGSCYGLVCFLCYNGCIALWNPTTQKTRFTPRPLTPFRNGSQFYGLGYDFSINDYKLVRCFQSDYSYPITSEVFNLKTGSWRTVPPPRITSPVWTAIHEPDAIGSFSNGAIHWIRKHKPVNSEKRETTILTFDIKNEVFSEILLPNGGKSEQRGFFSLGDLKGCLYAVYEGYFGVDMDVWVMKEYGVESSWSKVIKLDWTRFSCSYYMDPVCFTHDGNVVVRLDETRVVIYNLKEDTIKKFKKERSGCLDWVVYTESLVSPYG